MSQDFDISPGFNFTLKREDFCYLIIVLDLIKSKLGHKLKI